MGTTNDEKKRAWIYAEEHKVGRTLRILASAKKAATASWDRKIRLMEGYLDQLQNAAEDAGQLELFDIETAAPEQAAAIMDNPGAD